MTYNQRSKMSVILRFALFLALAVVIASCARPQPSPFSGRTILYYVDSVYDDDVDPDVALLALKAIESQTSATLIISDSTGFVTSLNSGPDLVVYFRQNGFDFPTGHLSALLDWVDDGGHLVFAHWDEGVDATTLATAMQSGFSFTANYSSMLVGHADLTAGLSSSTVPLTNPGWGTYNVGLTTGAGGTALAHYSGTAIPAIVRGLGGQTYVLGWLSDTVPQTAGSRLYTNIFRAAIEHLALTE